MGRKVKLIKLFKCIRNKHIIEMHLSNTQYDEFLKWCKDGKRVCPYCKPLNVQIEPIDDFASWSNAKIYKCANNHMYTVSLFSGGRVGLSFLVDKFENISREKLNSFDCLIDDCGESIFSIDETELEEPHKMMFKTITRVGDLWSKEKYPDPVQGNFDINQGQYKSSEFEQRNKERLKKIKRTRNTKPAGEIINKPTKEQSNKRISKKEAFRDE